MSRPRVGVVSPTEVAFPTVRTAFEELWPEAEPVCVLDQSLYADFINDDMTVPDVMPEECYARIARLLRYSQNSGADAIIFCGSVFGRLVEAGRDGMDVPVLTSYEAMIEAAFGQGNRLGVLATTPGTIKCLSDDIFSYAAANNLTYDLISDVADGAFEILLEGDRSAHDDLVVQSAQSLTDCDSLMLGQFSMGLVQRKIAQIEGRPIFTAPHTAVAKLKTVLGS
ncbi:MAG: aspartate/glutamate racemase family protein [Alphaproteobacteria bacterium]|nr:aspartate/glutamate racemase family protein [Alphaproteobacteria bacterium]